MAPFFTHLMFVIVRTIHNFKQAIILLFTGATVKIWLCQNNNFPFSQSAQLLDVHHYCRAFRMPSRSNFIATHHGFVSPKYILRKNVSLFCFENNLVVFVEWKHFGNDGSFYKASSSLPKYGKRRALRMIVMSEEMYHKLEEETMSNSSIKRLIHSAHASYKQCTGSLRTIHEDSSM